MEVVRWQGDRAGDVDALRDLVSRSWGESYKDETVWDYDGDFLDWYLAPGGGTKSLCHALYDGGEMVAFVGGIVRTYRFRDRFLPGFFATFLSIDPGRTRQGLATSLLSESMELMRAEYESTGFPAVYGFYLDAVQPTSRVFEKVARESGVAFHVLCRVNLRIKALDVPALRSVLDLGRIEALALRLTGGAREPTGDVAESGVRPYLEADLGACLTLANEAAASQTFTPHWTPETLARQLSFRSIASTLVCERAGAVGGFINYRVLGLLGKGARQKMGVIDWIADRGLRRRQRKRLVRRCLSELAQRGCCAVIFPDLPLLTQSALGHAGFLTNRRKVYIGALSYDHGCDLANVRRAYEVLC